MIGEFIEKWQPKDLIGLIVLITTLGLIANGINHIVSGIAIMIVTYYFRKRTEDLQELKQCKRIIANQTASKARKKDKANRTGNRLVQ